MGLKSSGSRSSIRNISENIPPLGIPDSVVHRWKLDEGSGSTASDSVGNNDLSFTGGPSWVSDSRAIGGYMLSFDGADDGASSASTVPTGSMTFTATIEFSSVDGNDIIQTFRGDNVAGERLLRFIQSGSGLQWFVQDASKNGFSVSVATPSTDTKHRVVAVLDTSNSQLRLYIDGSQVDSTSISGTYDINRNEHGVAYKSVSNGSYYSGSIDEPMIAQEAYSDEQVTNDYNRQPWS